MKVISKELNFESRSLPVILNTLKSAGFDSRLIGGCVRDAIIGKQIADIDIAVAARPEEIASELTKNNINVFRILPEFGVMMLAVGSEIFEIASLRKDIKCYGRKADVEFTNDFALDSQRRDFTINALSYDYTEQKIYDYQGGFEDLQNKKVKFIGDAEQRIKEDYSRILRFFRFSSIYAKELNSDGYKACSENKDGLKMIPYSIINKELDKIIMSPKCTFTMIQMHNAGIDLFGKLKLRNFSDTKNTPEHLETRYAILLSDNNPNLVRTKLKKLLFPKKLTDTIVDMISMKDGDPVHELLERWVNKYPMQKYLQFSAELNLIDKSLHKELSLKFQSLVPKFPVTSHCLMNLGITGKKLGETIKHLKNAWIKSRFTISKNELLNMLDK